MSIQYLYKNGEEACSKEPLKVRLDGVICGEIRKVFGGYAYFPKGVRCKGQVFPTVKGVQNSLEEA